jgi:hypothetical protein
VYVFGYLSIRYGSNFLGYRNCSTLFYFLLKMAGMITSISSFFFFFFFFSSSRQDIGLTAAGGTWNLTWTGYFYLKYIDNSNHKYLPRFSN